MGIYHPEIEEKLLNYPVEENILHEYDNYTYHIQIFMVPKNILFEYEKKMASGVPYEQTEYLLSENKFVIAESGVTNSIYIESLGMNTVPPTNYDNNSLSTIKLDLRMSEVGGNSLVNKIALCSKICGYDSYVLQKYFVSVWFTGYRNNNYLQGDIETVIGNKKYTYEVTIANIKSTMESDKTSYLLEMYPQYYSTLNNDTNRLTMCGEIRLSNDLTLQKCFEELEYGLNEQLKLLLGVNKYETIYGSRGAYKFIIVNPSLPDETSYDEFVKKEYNSGINSSMLANENSGIKNNANSKLSQLASEAGLGYGQFRIDNWNGVYSNRSSANEARNKMSEMSLKQGGISMANSTVSTTGVIITPNENDTIQTLSRKIIYMFPFLKRLGMDFVMEIKDEFVNSLDGINWYIHNIYINIVKIPGLDNMYKALMNDTTYDDYLFAPLANQRNYFEQLIQTGNLRKRYKWIFNGENIDVLGIKRDEDQLWYLNDGVSNNSQIFENTVDDNNNLNDESYMESTVSPLFSGIINSLKDKNKSKNVYVDDLYDIYRTGDYDLKLDQLYSFGITSSLLNFYKNDTVAQNTDTPEKNKIDSDKSIQNQMNASVLGYKNLFEKGQKIEIDIDILGDPYWLLHGSENISICNIPFMFPHIIVCMKSYIQVDGVDEYKEDTLMALNTLYVVTEIKSLFQNGVFTQKLKGYVVLPFIKSSIGSNDEIENIYFKSVQEQKLNNLPGQFIGPAGPTKNQKKLYEQMNKGNPILNYMGNDPYSA